jgi:nuclear transport factor 2 (NTF2) superfamily protein
MFAYSEERLRDFAARYTAAWCSQDPARVAAFFSADGSLRVNDAPPTLGRIAIAGVAQSFMSDLPDLTVILDGVDVRGDRAIYRWTLTGSKGGRHVRISGFEEWRMAADGLIAESQGHFDSEDYRRQLTL